MNPNGIRPRILKELTDIIVRPLPTVSQWSWESREVPVIWKLVDVSVFKKGKTEDSVSCMLVLGEN